MLKYGSFFLDSFFFLSLSLLTDRFCHAPVMRNKDHNWNGLIKFMKYFFAGDIYHNFSRFFFQPKSVKATPTTTTNSTSRRSAPRYTPRRGILEESDSDTEVADKSIRSRHALKRGTKEVPSIVFSLLLLNFQPSPLEI